MKKDTTRRLARIQFSRAVPVPKWVIVELFKQLPDDSMMLGVTEDMTRMTSSLIFASEKFGEIKEGTEIPVIGVQIDGPNQSAIMTIPDNPEGFLEGLEGL